MARRCGPHLASTSNSRGYGSRLPPGRRSLWPSDDRKRSLETIRRWHNTSISCDKIDACRWRIGGRGRRLTTASRLYRRRGLSARMPKRGRRDPNDGTGVVADVASVVILVQETREFVVVEPAPACVQAAQEFELAACEYRHGSAQISAFGRDAGSIAEHHRVTFSACRRTASGCSRTFIGTSSALSRRDRRSA